MSDLFGDEDEQVFEMRWRWLFVGKLVMGEFVLLS